MSDTTKNEVTRILSGIREGDRQAADELLPFVYDKLRRMAQKSLAHEPPGLTLQATALVHEAFLRLVDQSKAQFNDRAHFLAVASQAIRRVLIDYARQQRAQKRGGGRWKMTLVEDIARAELAVDEIDLMDLNEALKNLEELSDRQARVVEFRFFGGLTIDETAAVLDVSPGTVKNDWRFARAWLRRQLEDPDGS